MREKETERDSRGDSSGKNTDERTAIKVKTKENRGSEKLRGGKGSLVFLSDRSILTFQSRDIRDVNYEKPFESGYSSLFNIFL